MNWIAFTLSLLSTGGAQSILQWLLYRARVKTRLSSGAVDGPLGSDLVVFFAPVLAALIAYFLIAYSARAFSSMGAAPRVMAACGVALVLTTVVQLATFMVIFNMYGT